MSKQSRKKARRRKHKHKIVTTICTRCGTPGKGTTAELLTNLAEVLNSCTDAGIEIRVRHGALIARQGYVLPLSGGLWTARTLSYDPFVSISANSLEDDDS